MEEEATTPIDPRLLSMLQEQPYPLLFATLDGSHVYGFASPDSDYDVRGVHLPPVRAVLGLGKIEETFDHIQPYQGIEIDLVTHDVHKFFLLLLKSNGNALEAVLSPLVVQTTPEHDELKTLASKCIGKLSGMYYLSYANNQWVQLLREKQPRLKKLLYVYRTLLTGLHLMRTGLVEANLSRLSAEYTLSFLPDLITQKRVGIEDIPPVSPDQEPLEAHRGHIDQLRGALETAMVESLLPAEPTQDTWAAFSDLLVRLRLKSQKSPDRLGEICFTTFYTVVNGNLPLAWDELDSFRSSFKTPWIAAAQAVVAEQFSRDRDDG